MPHRTAGGFGHRVTRLERENRVTGGWRIVVLESPATAPEVLTHEADVEHEALALALGDAPEVRLDELQLAVAEEESSGVGMHARDEAAALWSLRVRGVKWPLAVAAFVPALCGAREPVEQLD